MFVLPLTILLTLRFITCHPAGTQAPELYFRLLQTDGQLNQDTRYPHKQSRRPSPSEHLPIDDLIENQSEIYDPRPGDINIKLLRAQMGQAFDREYMSIHGPRHKGEKSTLIPLIKGRPKGQQPRFLKLLRSARLQDGRKIKLNVSKKERKKIQKYVWSLTFCPVKYSWKYLGIRFWPQWIKQGACSNKRSCSLPEGMNCKPSQSTTKTFLRWHCIDFKGRNSCKWIPFQYPIITECACSC